MKPHRRRCRETAPTTADLPVRAAAPVDYVRTCPNAPIGGTGFFVIPGTETCLRISGYVRTEYRFAEYRDTQTERGQDTVDFFARGRLAFDARTPTEFGTLRSFVRVQAERSDDAVDEDRAELDQAFIQFAGLTAGRITSFFSFFGGNLMSVSSGLSDPSLEVLAYTATFGAGFSATVSIEDGKYRRTGFGYGGQELPDLVANLNVSQAWGSAQIMGALHQIRPAAAGIDEDTGFAIGAGVNIRLPMIAAGDALWLQAVYSDGALDYADAPNRVAEFDVGLNDAYVNAAGTGVATTEAWSVGGAFRHFWTPTIWSDFQAAYGEVDVPTVAEAAAGTVLLDGAVSDYSWWQVGTRLNWRPVAGLTFAADVAYWEIDPDRAYRVYNDGALVDLPATTDDGSRWAGRIRIQRDF